MTHLAIKDADFNQVTTKLETKSKGDSALIGFNLNGGSDMTRLALSIRNAAAEWLATLTPPPPQLLVLAAQMRAGQAGMRRNLPNPFTPRFY